MAATIPDYCTYELDKTIVSTNNEVITATVTANLPFTTSSDFASAKWYYVELRGKWLQYDGSSIGTSESQVTSDAGQWAFIGDPYTGFTVINKKAGSGNYLTYSGTTLQFGETSTTWTVAQHPSTYVSGFWIYFHDGTNYHTPYAGSNGAVTALSNTDGLTSSNDGGSSQGGGAWVISAVPDDYSDMVTANIQPYINAAADNSVFNISTSVASALSAAITTANSDGSVSLTEYNELLAALNSNIKYPTTGYYRMKSYSTSQYAGLTGSNPTTEAEGTSASTVLYLTKSADANTYTILVQGVYLNEPTQYNNVPTSNTTCVFTPAVAAPGYASFTAGANNLYGSIGLDGIALKGAAATGIDANPGAYWALEAATTLDLTLNGPINGSYYATLCLPFSVTISGAEAYTLTLNASKDGLTLSEAMTEVPAGTPVLLRGSSATATAAIATDAAYASAPLTTTSLTGTFVNKDVTAATDYFLGSDGTNVGFYKWNGTTLKANRAYLEATALSADVKGFALDFDTETAIQAVADETSALPVYNLAGQRVENTTRGLYIVGGKKVVVR